jgi:hypothetical protein
MGQVGVHDGQWTFVERSTNGVICSHCERRCFEYWAWWSTPTKTTRTYCTDCVNDLVGDDDVETPTPKEAAMPSTRRNRKTKTADPIVDEGNIVGEDPEPASDENEVDIGDLSVADDDTEHTTAENQAIVDAAVSKPNEDEKDEAPKPEPKDKAPTTGEVAGAWIRAQLEEDPKTKPELIELAAKSNPAKFENPKGKDRPKVPRSTKWIVEHKKIGEMCPGNAGGHYINEGLDSRKGGVDVLIDEKTKALSLKP